MSVLVKTTRLITMLDLHKCHLQYALICNKKRHNTEKKVVIRFQEGSFGWIWWSFFKVWFSDWSGLANLVKFQNSHLYVVRFAMDSLVKIQQSAAHRGCWALHSESKNIKSVCSVFCKLVYSLYLLSFCEFSKSKLSILVIQ